MRSNANRLQPRHAIKLACRTAKTVLPLLAATLVLSACGGSTDTSPTWQEVTNRTACQNIQQTRCTGDIGFTVLANGTYVAGPDAQGKILQGALESNEFNSFNASATALAGEIASGNAEKCAEILLAPPPGANDLVGIGLSDLTNYSVQAGSPQCGADGAQVVADINQLTKKYYPANF